MRFKKPLFLIGAVIFPLLIGATSPALIEHIRTFTYSAAQPVLEFQHNITSYLSSEITYILKWRGLREENESLRSEVEQLRSELIRFNEVEKKAGRLEKLLDLKTKSFSKEKAARVIARDPSHWAQYILINRGLHDGVRKNSVLVHTDGLVGKVVQSGSHSARAILLTDRESRVSAMDQRTRDNGLIEGTGSPELKLTYLDRDSDIQVGDIIISAGMGGIYPKGIPIGKVELVADEEGHASLYAIIKPFVTFSKLEEVLCVSSQTKD